jgi:hypothetical protein
VKLRTKIKELNMLSWSGWIKRSCNLNMFGSSFMCIPRSRKVFWIVIMYLKMLPLSLKSDGTEPPYRSFSCLAGSAHEWLVFTIFLFPDLDIIAVLVLSSLSWEFLHDGLCLEGAWWRFVHLLPWSECFDYRSCFVTLIFLFHGSLHNAWAVFP